MNFSYKGKSQDGSIIKGVLSTSSKDDAISDLKAQGVVPFFVEEVKKKKSGDISFSKLLRHVSLQEKMIFTKNLAGMIEAGLPLYRALTVIEKQTQNDYFKESLDAIMKEINQGKTLSDAMENYPKIFSSLFIAMVRAGEESGGLVQNLRELGIHLEKAHQLRQRVKGAMLYPSIIVSVMLIIGVLMFIFVIPTLVAVFVDLDLDLPLTTRVIIFISDAFSSNPFLVLLILVGFLGGIFYFAKSPKTQEHVDMIILKLPIIKTIVKEMNTARTARTLSSLLSSGVGIGKAIEITQNVVQNTHYKKVLVTADDRIQKGIPLSQTFKEHLDLYPIMFTEMVEVGEETGKVSEMFLEVAEFYENEVDEKTKNLSTIIEPILMVFIGAAVGFFAVSMIQPMYSLVQGFSV